MEADRQMRRQPTNTVRSPRWAQYVDAPSEWAAKNRWLLEEAFRAFDRDGGWPKIEEVQRSLARTPERAVAVSQLMVDIPPSLGARHSQDVVLTVRALSYCPDAAPLLELFVRAMKSAVDRYPGDGPEPPILYGSAIKSALDLTDEDYRKVSTLLFSDGWFLGSGGGDPGGNWNRELRAEILLLKDVEDIEGYLDTLARYRFGPPEIEATAPEEPALVVPSGPRRWLAKRDVSVLDLLVIGVIVGLIVGIVLLLLG